MQGARTIAALICFGLFPFLIPGCKEKPKNPVSEYGDALTGAYKDSQSAGDQANLDALKTAVSNYHAANEGYPKSLQDLGNLLNTQIDLSKYDYDAATGTVTLKRKR